MRAVLMLMVLMGFAPSAFSEALSDCQVKINITSYSKAEVMKAGEDVKSKVNLLGALMLNEIWTTGSKSFSVGPEDSRYKKFLAEEQKRMKPYVDSPDVTWSSLNQTQIIAQYPKLRLEFEATEEDMIRKLYAIVNEMDDTLNPNQGLWLTFGTSLGCKQHKVIRF